MCTTSGPDIVSLGEPTKTHAVDAVANGNPAAAGPRRRRKGERGARIAAKQMDYVIVGVFADRINDLATGVYRLGVVVPEVLAPLAAHTVLAWVRPLEPN